MPRWTYVLMLGFALQRLAPSADPHRVGVDVARTFPARFQENSALFRNDADLVEERFLMAKRAKKDTSTYTQAALTAALATFRSYFTTELSQPSRVATLTENNEDILVAEWASTRPREMLRPVLLWDEPYWNTFIFECDAAQIVSPPVLQKLIEDVSRWNNDYFQGAKMFLRLPPPRRGAAMVGFSQKSPFRPWQFDIGPQVQFSAVLHGPYAYLTISFSSMLGSQPEELKGIAERFPPLDTRVGSWPTVRLVQELRKHTGTLMYPLHKRNHILMRALLTHEDFGPAELKALLGENTCQWQLVSASLTEASEKAHRTEAFLSVIEEYSRERNRCPM